jgi:hypothetical protein
MSPKRRPARDRDRSDRPPGRPPSVERSHGRCRRCCCLTPIRVRGLRHCCWSIRPAVRGHLVRVPARFVVQGLRCHVDGLLALGGWLPIAAHAEARSDYRAVTVRAPGVTGKATTDAYRLLHRADLKLSIANAFTLKDTVHGAPPVARAKPAVHHRIRPRSIRRALRAMLLRRHQPSAASRPIADLRASAPGFLEFVRA